MTHGGFLRLVIMIKNATEIALISMNVGARILKKNKNSETMKVYISGKIGEEVLSEATRQKLAKAERMLRAKGFDVFNPTTSGLGEHAEYNVENATYKTSFYQEILLCDLVQLAQCDAIYMLADWSRSNGANVELDFAVATGKQRYWELEEDAFVFGDNAGNFIDMWMPIE